MYHSLHFNHILVYFMVITVAKISLELTVCHICFICFKCNLLFMTKRNTGSFSEGFCIILNKEFLELSSKSNAPQKFLGQTLSHKNTKQYSVTALF